MNEARKAACVIGWPIEHSRSPLIHNYWIKQHNLDAEYRREAVPPDEFADFIKTCARTAMSAPTSPCRTSRRRSALSTPDERARAVGAANTLWYDGDVLALDQYRRRGLPRQSRCRHAGLGPRAGKRDRARRRRRRARRGLCADRARGAAHLCHQPHARARRGAEEAVRRAPLSGRLGRDHRASSAAPACWSTPRRSA